MCADGWACVAAALSLIGTVIAAIQAVKASNTLRLVRDLRSGAPKPEPEPAPQREAGRPTASIIDAANRTAKAIEHRSATWSPVNHRMLMIGIGCVIAGNLITTAMAFFGRSG